MAEEPDGETTYYLQIRRATINFFQEEWEQFLAFVKDIEEIKPDEDQFYRLEFDNVDIWMDEEDWREFKNLTKEFVSNRHKTFLRRKIYRIHENANAITDVRD